MDCLNHEIDSDCGRKEFREGLYKLVDLGIVRLPEVEEGYY